jgi:tRNA(Leu) C34 or U34 (ribose-2'-O)-methylase TrmL
VPRGYFMLGLFQPKSSENLGSILRLAHNFGAAQVLVGGTQVRPGPTNTFKSERHIPLTYVEDLHAVIPHGCVPIAVDLIEGSQSLHSYEHPERAMYVFGPEDGTLDATVTSWCQDIIHIPMWRCANLAVAAGIVLYDRSMKQKAPKHSP